MSNDALGPRPCRTAEHLLAKVPLARHCCLQQVAGRCQSIGVFPLASRHCPPPIRWASDNGADGRNVRPFNTCLGSCARLIM
eukprot:3497307-Pleurochrysis_carterae.AAC.1